MEMFKLPADLLAMIYIFSAIADAASGTPTTMGNNTLLPPTGSGPAYATSCVAERNAYTVALNSWNSVHNNLTTSTLALGGPDYIPIKYIQNASTLCDLHPRVTWDNPVTLSTGTVTRPNPITGHTTITQTFGRVYPAPSPSCSIKPSDCDPLWASYSSSLKTNATATFATPLTTPFCQNVSVADYNSAIDSSIYGCGKCTIYGEHVQLVYWPEPTDSVSLTRDYCATTPTATLTSYGSDAVITAYAGKSLGNDSYVYAPPQSSDPLKQTITTDGHAFTEGTAYISIGTVWATDRCSHTFGSVTNAILAMPSESVLSLRYYQDKFQRLMETDKITGYPVNYGDFQTPIPWSAWGGMNQCTPGAWGGPLCDVIDERSYRPQLAIPPQITELSPDFKDCQMWYNGLFDPPLALTEAKVAASITNPFAQSTPQATSATPAATAEQNTLPTGYGGNRGSNDHSGGSESSNGAVDTIPGSGSGNNGNTNNNGHGAGNSGSGQSSESGTGNGSGNHGSGSNTNSGGGSGNAGSNSNSGSDTNNDQSGGSIGSYINSGMSPNSNNEQNGDQDKPSYGLSDSPSHNPQQAAVPCPSSEPWSYTFTLSNGQTIDATGYNNVAVIGTVTCVLNGPPQSVAEGVTASYESSGVVFNEAHVYNFSTGSGADLVIAPVAGETHVAVQTAGGGVVVVNGTPLTPGGNAATLSDGEVFSAATNGVVVVTRYTVGRSASSSASAEVGSSTTTSGEGNSATRSGSAAAASSSTADAAGLLSAHGISSLVVGLFVAAVLGA